jgi:hypothetical protein
MRLVNADSRSFLSRLPWAGPTALRVDWYTRRDADRGENLLIAPGRDADCARVLAQEG